MKNEAKVGDPYINSPSEITKDSYETSYVIWLQKVIDI